MEPREIKFKADGIFLQKLKDHSYQIKITTGEYEVEAMQELLGLPEGIYEVTIKPEIQ